MPARPLALVALGLAFLVGAHAGSPDGAAGGWGYDGAGAIVVSSPAASPLGGPTLVDNGAVVCDTATGRGVGGTCVPFGAGPASIVVHDEGVPDSELAFQVCIDNDGDGICGGASTDPTGQCGDDVFFSHGGRNDTGGGHFFNPLGPLPNTFRTGCPGGPWQGYVVILCAGVHSTQDAAGGAEAHEHHATRGTVGFAAAGTGFGDFCGGTFAAKAYRAV
jgi:hypothetical protein